MKLFNWFKDQQTPLFSESIRVMKAVKGSSTEVLTDETPKDDGQVPWSPGVHAECNLSKKTVAGEEPPDEDDLEETLDEDVEEADLEI